MNLKQGSMCNYVLKNICHAKKIAGEMVFGHYPPTTHSYATVDFICIGWINMTDAISFNQIVYTFICDFNTGNSQLLCQEVNRLILT